MIEGKRTGRERLNEKGFTLLELLVAGALFTVVMLSVFSVAVMSQQIFTDNGTYARLTQGGMEMLRHIEREIGQSSPNTSPARITITADADGNSEVCFQIPVDWDNDGDVVTSDMNPDVEWGAYDWVGQTDNGRLNGWTCYSVDTDEGQLIRDVRDSSMNAIDGLTRIVASNVQSFQASRDTDRLTMSMTVEATDEIGKDGTPRVHEMTFTSTTILRNAVS